jgi:glycosyltransferase 2 family protein
VTGKPSVFQTVQSLLAAGRTRSVGPKLLLSLVIAFAFFWLLRRGALPMLPPDSAFGPVIWWAVPVYVLLNMLGTFLRTYRWLYLLRPIKPDLQSRRVMGIGLVGFAAVLFAPLRTGEIVRPWLLARDGDINFVKAAGTVAAERIVDGLTLAILLTLGLLVATPLSPLPDQLGKLPLPVSAVPAAAQATLVLFAAAFVTMALFYAFRDRARRFVHGLLNPVSSRLAKFVTDKVEHLAEGLRFLPSRQYSGRFARDSVVYWFVSCLSIWVLLTACGARASLVEACVTMGIMGIGTLIPSGPGFFGVHQLSAYCALAMFFPEQVVLHAGAVFAFISYVTQIGVTAAGCAIGFWLMGSSAKVAPVSADSGVQP